MAPEKGSVDSWGRATRPARLGRDPSVPGEDEGSFSALPAELDQLVHHVELHRSGWWDQALETLVLATAWLKAPITPAALVDHLYQELDGRLTRDRADELIALGLAAGTLVELATGEIKASEELAATFAAQFAAVQECEARLHLRFVEAVADSGVDADPEVVWTDVKDLYLGPLVRESGARMYQVITASERVENAVPSYDALVKPICDRYGHEIRAALISFLDPSDPDVRSFVLRMVNANFVREAAALDSAVLEGLTASRGRPQGVSIFLDTNFLFSFLRLHDNPANEMANDLMELIGRCRATLGIDLYVLPITIEEARRVLRGVTARLESLQPTRNMAAAAREFTSTGLVAKYLEAASQSASRLRPNDFFGPYDSGLPIILGDRGIKLFNDELDHLRVDQGVIDDIHLMNERQANRERGPKPYETNLHDAVLWRFCSDRRPAAADSPLELGYWVSTLDYGFIGFDRSKSRQLNKPPICLTPAALVQLLQFWAPRSEELDRALVGSIRQPLLFLEFDSASEQTTIDILRSLSRYENIADLPVNTLYGVISDEALRARLSTSPNLTDEQQVELVESAIIQEAHELERRLEQARHSKQAAERAAEESMSMKEGELERLRTELAHRTAEVDALTVKSASLDELVAASVERLEVVSSEGDAKNLELQTRLGALEREQAYRRERSRTLLLLGGATALLALCSVAIESLIDERISDWLAWSAPAVNSICLVIILARWRIEGNELYGRTRVGILRGLSKVAMWVLAAALAGVVGNLVYDGLQDEDQKAGQPVAIGAGSHLSPLENLVVPRAEKGGRSAGAPELEAA